MVQLFVSPGKAESWEDEILQGRAIASGDSFRVDLYGYDSPVFDVRVVDVDGDSYTFWDVDVEQYDITVTLDNMD